MPKRIIWRERVWHALHSNEHAVWYARSRGLLLTVVRFRSGGVHGTVERKRAGDGCVELVVAERFADSVAATFVREWCEARAQEHSA